MKHVAIICTAAMMLSGCIVTPAVVGSAVLTGITAYCIGVTDAGKQAIRDKTTGGTPLLACPEAIDD